ncbi:MAG TPA: NAD(P)-binding domain-containing protein [Bacteroidales bacterium]|nr:NAD(P)-binding domain-containing protein [Bacteroidales bacterium]
MEKTIGFIGGGRITRIFLQAFRNRGCIPEKVVVFDISNDVLISLQNKYPTVETATLEQVANQDIVFIALHPPVIMDTLDRVKSNIKQDSCVISLAPKITIDKISAKLNGHGSIARLIPNATSYINKGYNPVCFSSNFNRQDEIMEMLELLGHTFIVEESKLEAYAIASAMLPNYFWFQWQEMHRICKQMGLNESEARETVEKTLVAGIETLYHSGLSYEEVIDLIPVKPIAAHEPQIREVLSNTLSALFEKIKP